MAMPIGGGRAPDTEAPRVQIDSLADGDTVAEIVTLAAAAADDVGVTGVTFHIDGVALGTEVTAPPYWAAWDTRTAANGVHAIHAEARDTGGNVASSATVTVTVTNPRAPAANRAPVVSAGVDISVTGPTPAPALLQGSVERRRVAVVAWDCHGDMDGRERTRQAEFERPDEAQTMVRFARRRHLRALADGIGRGSSRPVMT